MLRPAWPQRHRCCRRRIAYNEIHADEKKETDNGSCYRSRDWRDTLAAAGIAHERTRPYRPQTNSKVERLNRTLLDEWAYARPPTAANRNDETPSRSGCTPAITTAEGQPPASRSTAPGGDLCEATRQGKVNLGWKVGLRPGVWRRRSLSGVGNWQVSIPHLCHSGWLAMGRRKRRRHGSTYVRALTCAGRHSGGRCARRHRTGADRAGDRPAADGREGAGGGGRQQAGLRFPRCAGGADQLVRAG
ncbi:hypothetical protein B1C81_35070 [Streptomyces sp. HG99]|nr:hypothetical protein B1C81_35070 [Streptomyces sp. HG99]